MRRRKNKQPSGYTIVEVMIVLAVSSVMFLIASQFINGKQARTSFTQGANGMASQIQDIIEQVSDGRYSDTPLNCTFNGSSTNINTGSASNQGQNPSCVFLGNVLYLWRGRTYYWTSILAGGRLDSVSGQPITDFLQTHPTSLGTISPPDVTPSYPQTLQLYGIKFTDASGTAHCYSPSAPCDSLAGTFGIAFTQGLGATTTSGGTTSLKSGANPVVVYRVKGTTNGQHQYVINDDYGGTPIESASLCLTDGSRYAEVEIGDNSNSASQLTTAVKMDGSTSCF